MRSRVCIPILLFAIFAACFTVAGQSNPPSARGLVIEVTYNKDKPFVYQQIGSWAWFGDFKLTDDWRTRMGERRIRAVKLDSRDESGSVKVKITALRGVNHVIEDSVGEYNLTEAVLAVTDLRRFGIAPFELRLVRALPTVSELPVVSSSAPSLLVGVEPITADLPSFKATFLNNATKPVLGFAYKTSIDGKTQYIALPYGRQGKNLIEPDAAYEQILRYPIRSGQVSTGEVPQLRESGLVFHIQAVVFSDGTWEGDPKRASSIRALKLGEKIQLARIIRVLRSPAVASPAAVAAELERVPYNVDVSEVSPLVREFSGLPKGAPEYLRIGAEAASTGLYKDFKATFVSSAPSDPNAFAEAVRREIARLEAWLGSLP